MTDKKLIQTKAPQFVLFYLVLIYKITRFTKRGYRKLNRCIFSIFPKCKNNFVTINAKKRGVFCFKISDDYYNQLLNSNFKYEEDLENFLFKLKELDFTFIDAGANYGYWSVLLSSDAFNSKSVHAFELDPSNFSMLELNRSMNNNNFNVYNVGVYNVDGDFVQVTGSHHSTRHISTNLTIDSSKLPLVETIRLDTFINKNIDISTNILVKLDVEGVEKFAIEGLQGVNRSRIAIVYEDHGKDLKCETTEILINIHKYDCYFIKSDGSLVKIYNIQQLQPYKKNPYCGYNLLAVPNSTNDNFFGANVVNKALTLNK